MLYRIPWWQIKPRRLEHPLAPRLKRPRITKWRDQMADVTIPFAPPDKRKDGSALAPSQIKQIDFDLSGDNGATWTGVGHRAGTDTSITLQGLDVGQYLVRGYTTDTQEPAFTSDFSAVVGFVVPAPALAAPMP